MLQITHYGIFDTGTVADCNEQVDRLKGFRLKVTGRGSRGVQAEGIQVEGLRLVYLVYSVCLVYLVEPDRPASA